jgi:hypothetical protein
MRSSWPVLIGIAFIAVAAYWYDARNAAASNEAAAAGAGRAQRSSAAQVAQSVEARVPAKSAR